MAENDNSTIAEPAVTMTSKKGRVVLVPANQVEAHIDGGFVVGTKTASPDMAQTELPAEEKVVAEPAPVKKSPIKKTPKS